MTGRTRTGKVKHMYELDSKSYMDSAARMGRLLDKVFGRYGEPKMSLEELRATLNRQLGKTSLTELVLKEREEGC